MIFPQEVRIQIRRVPGDLEYDVIIEPIRVIYLVQSLNIPIIVIIEHFVLVVIDKPNQSLLHLLEVDEVHFVNVVAVYEEGKGLHRHL